MLLQAQEQQNRSDNVAATEAVQSLQAQLRVTHKSGASS